MMTDDPREHEGRETKRYAAAYEEPPWELPKKLEAIKPKRLHGA